MAAAVLIAALILLCVQTKTGKFLIGLGSVIALWCIYV